MFYTSGSSSSAKSSIEDKNKKNTPTYTYNANANNINGINPTNGWGSNQTQAPGKVNYGGAPSVVPPTDPDNSTTVVTNSNANASVNAITDLLNAQRAQYEAQLAEMQRLKQEAAQNAYNANLSALTNAYNSRVGNLGANYESTKGQLADNYNMSVNNLNQNAENALREAYINRMQNERALAQQMALNGINGGASETTIANMLNNYGNNRNDINTQVANNLASLENAYNNNLASAEQNYNDALNNAENQRLGYIMNLNNDLNNGIANSYNDMYNAYGNLSNDYTKAMIDLIEAQEKARIANSNIVRNTNANSGISVADTSASAPDFTTRTGITNYIKNRLENLGSISDITNELYSNGITDANLIKQIFKDLKILE